MGRLTPAGQAMGNTRREPRRSGGARPGVKIRSNVRLALDTGVSTQPKPPRLLQRAAGPALHVVRSTACRDRHSVSRSLLRLTHPACDACVRAPGPADGVRGGPHVSNSISCDEMAPERGPGVVTGEGTRPRHVMRLFAALVLVAAIPLASPRATLMTMSSSQSLAPGDVYQFTTRVGPAQLNSCFGPASDTVRVRAAHASHAMRAAGVCLRDPGQREPSNARPSAGPRHGSCLSCGTTPGTTPTTRRREKEVPCPTRTSAMVTRTRRTRCSSGMSWGLGARGDFCRPCAWLGLRAMYFATPLHEMLSWPPQRAHLRGVDADGAAGAASRHVVRL